MAGPSAVTESAFDDSTAFHDPHESDNAFSPPELDPEINQLGLANNTSPPPKPINQSSSDGDLPTFHGME